jgi:hypothetical protein
MMSSFPRINGNRHTFDKVVEDANNIYVIQRLEAVSSFELTRRRSISLMQSFLAFTSSISAIGTFFKATVTPSDTRFAL